MLQRLLLGFLLLCVSQLSGQNFVFPGDANNNGIVDHYDVLPIGFAYGSLGPTRPVGAPQEQQEILASWPAVFPGGLNFIHADTDANGRVDIFDFLVHSQNLYQSLPEEQPLLFVAGQSGVDAELSINEGQNLDPGSGITAYTLPLRWESEAIEANVNGLAFTLIYNPDYVANINFTFADGWISEDGQSFRFIRHRPGEIDIAVTRFGSDPVDGGDGILGSLDFVVIEDLVGLLPNDQNGTYPFLDIVGVQAFDGDFHLIPVVPNGAGFNGPSSVPNNSNEPPLNNALFAKAFPNPVAGRLNLNSTHAFDRVEAVSLTGQTQLLYTGPPRTELQYHLEDQWPPGLFYLRISGAKGLSLLPIVHLPSGR